MRIQQEEEDHSTVEEAVKEKEEDTVDQAVAGLLEDQATSQASKTMKEN